MMTLSFSLTPGLQPHKNESGKIPVLVTGATGNIGQYFAEHASSDFELRLMVTKHDDRSRHLEPFGKVIEGDITSLDNLKDACSGIDTVVHLAGEASPKAPWENLLPLNIEGSYNMMAAARAAGCRRVIYASSIHAVSGYAPDVQVKSSDPVNPGDLYGVTKCFAEALGRYMAEQEDLSVICLRIGSFQPTDFARSKESTAVLDAWISERDLTSMIDLCIRDAHLRYAVFNSLSDNRFKRLDITDAREILGYQPQDDLTRLNPDLKELNLDEKVSSHSFANDPRPDKSGLRNDV